MASLYNLCIIVVLFVSCSQAYLTGESCRDYRGHFATRWTQCETCAEQTCRCVYENGGLQADCDPVSAVPLRVPYGCNIGAPIRNSTHITQCCPITCQPVPETCETSFGGSFREGESWTKCGNDISCCFETCQCVRLGRSLEETCQLACPRLLLEPGCQVVAPFQNATYHNCCQIECQAEQQCTSNVGDRYNVGDTWDECTPGSGCCKKTCSCRRRGDIVESECHELCAKIAVPEGCRVVDSFPDANNPLCCRTECQCTRVRQFPETCTSSFGAEYPEGESWSECIAGNICCWNSCQCARAGSILQKLCHEVCAGIRLEPGCRLIEGFQNATYQNCCRSECPDPSGGSVYLP